jgi:hypothetical protein
MREADRRTKLDRITEHLDTLARVDLATFDKSGRIIERAGRNPRTSVVNDALLEAYRRCATYAGRGYPADTSAQPQGRSSGHGDSTTERAASRRDPFELDRKQADAHLDNALRSLRWLASFTIRYIAPSADANTALRDDCASCARIGKLVDPFRTPQSVGGVPAKPLCSFCYKFVLAERNWPPTSVLEAHHEGRRITTKMVEEATRP